MEKLEKSIHEVNETAIMCGMRSLKFHKLTYDEKDTFTVSTFKKAITVKATSDQSAHLALHVVDKTLKNKRLQEFLGTTHALVPYRVLWLDGEKHLKISDSCGIAVPDWLFHDEKRDHVIQTALKNGYNTFIFGGFCSMFQDKPKDSLDLPEDLFSQMQKLGIRVYIKPVIFLDRNKDKLSFSFFHPPFQKIVKNIVLNYVNTFPSIDGLFWESPYCYTKYHHHLTSKDATSKELVLQEIKCIEDALSGSKELLYYLPTSSFDMAKEQSTWIIDVMSYIGPKTFMVFTPLLESCHDRCFSYHPFLDRLRKVHHQEKLPILPMINSGGHKFGDGLWPNVCFPLLDDFISRFDLKRLLGMIHLFPKLPKPGSLQDLNLWTSGLAMWDSYHPHLLSEIWLSDYHLDSELPIITETLLEIHRMIIKTKRLLSMTSEVYRGDLSQEECKIYAEEILAPLSKLMMSLQSMRFTENDEYIPLSKYVPYFARDIKRLVLHFLQCYNVSHGNMMDKDDMLAGFWTLAEHGSGSGIRGGMKIELLTKPNMPENHNEIYSKAGWC